MTDRMTEKTRTDPREPVGADGAPRGLHSDRGVVGGFASEDEEDDEDE